MKNNLLLSIISIFLVSCSIKNKVENDYVPILVDMDKNEVFLDSYKENVLILNLWATWCKPCIACEISASLNRIRCPWVYTNINKKPKNKLSTSIVGWSDINIKKAIIWLSIKKK